MGCCDGWLYFLVVFINSVENRSLETGDSRTKQEAPLVLHHFYLFYLHIHAGL